VKREPSHRTAFLSMAPSMWGAEQSLLAIASAMHKAGLPTEVIAASSALADAWCDESGQACRRVSEHRSRLRRNVAAALVVWRVSRGSTVVVFDYEVLPAMVALRPVLRLKRVQVAFDLHIVIEGKRAKRLLRWLLRRVDRCVAVSDFVAQQVVDVVPTSVVWRPVRGSDQTHPDKLCRGPRAVVGLVGRIDRQKRPEVAIDLCMRVQPRPILVLRGEPHMAGGAYLSEVLELGEQSLGLDSFHYEGRVDADRAMSGLDVLILTNDREPSGRVVAEAQMQGIPVLVPDRGGAREFVVPDVTGKVFDPDKPDEAARALESLLDPVVQKRVGASARSFARRHYDFDQQGRKYWRALSGELLSGTE